MTTTVDPYTPPVAGTQPATRHASPPPVPQPATTTGHWVWVEGPRTWAGLNVPVVRDPIFWVWVFFMTSTTVTTILTQLDTDKVLSILVVSWVGCTAIYWFVPALARQVWRHRKPRKPELTVTRG